LIGSTDHRQAVLETTELTCAGSRKWMPPSLYDEEGDMTLAFWQQPPRVYDASADLGKRTVRLEGCKTPR
jgi:hypothetical protein